MLLGYSGHALVVADTFSQTKYEVVGYLDKNECLDNILGVPYLGFEQNIEDLNKIKGMLIFPAIGDNRLREKVSLLINSEGFNIPIVISPIANVSPKATICEGTLVCQGVCISPFVRIGKGVIINTASVIEHECQIDDFAHIAPGAVLAGNVKVGKYSFVGANAVIKQGVEIGKNAIIGAGSVILKDVPDNTIMVGNPAHKIIK